MRGKCFAVGLLAAVGVLAWGGSSRGGDTVRLNRLENTPTRNLVDDGQGAQTIRTWHHGFGWGWGYRGWGWGGFYRPYWGWGGFYRPYWGWGGFYRPYWGWGGLGLYRPYYGFGIGYGLGFGGFYPGFGIGYGGFFWPCAGVEANVYTLSRPAVTPGSPLPGAPGPRAVDPAPQPGNDGTFPYDGGPTNPVPKPKDKPSSTTPSVPLEGRAVSLPKAAPKWTYPAYGETGRRTTHAPARTYLTRGEQKKTGSH